jgi:Skp family chaperone for outer membrane proteins
MLGRFAAASVLAFAALGWAAVAVGQQVAPAVTSGFQTPVLTINQQRFFEESQFGRSSLSALEAESRALQAEIRKVESDLEIEERVLTERRATLSPSQFQPLASAFDDKVEKIRASWAEKDRDLKRQREQDQQKFFESAVPVLAQLMQEMGAVMLIEQSSVILSLDRVDITQTAIARIDAQLTKPSAAAEPDPAAQTAPDAVADPAVQKP